MSDDLVTNLAWLASPDAERLSDHQRINEFVKAGSDAAQALTEARSEIERWAVQALKEEDCREMWRTRALAAESELSTLRARVREVMGPFASTDLLECKDCVDNDGKHYQSQWLADALRAARQLNEDLKDA